MAEVFGAVAGAIGIAPIVLELAKSVKRLKDFCHDVKNAPEAIQDLVDEIDDMSSVLTQLSARNLHDTTAGDQTIEQCLTHCVRANARISTVVTELQGSISAHKRRASITFPFNKSKLKELTQKLERAKSSLFLACQVYSISVAEARFADAQQRFQDLAALLQTQGANQEQNFHALASGQALLLHSARSTQQTSTGGSVSKLGTVIHGRSQKRNVNDAESTRSQLSWIWNICTARATLGWSRHFRTYSILPWDTAGVLACGNGDLQSLQRLLCSHQLSIHDRIEDGRTLFIFAVNRGQTHIARFLQQMGADVNSANKYGTNPAYSLLLAIEYGTYGYDVDERCRNLDFMIEDCGNEDPELDVYPKRQVVLKPPQAWTHEDQCIMLRRLPPWSINGFSISRLLRDTQPLASVWDHEYDDGKYLIYWIASQWDEAWSSQTRDDGRALLVARAVDAGIDLHQFDGTSRVHRNTPLQHLLYSADYYYAGSYTDLTRVLRSWVAALDAAGVNILEYGRREAEFWPSNTLSSLGQRVIGFSHGGSVSDWHVFIEHAGDSYAGIFWDMVENPEPAVPGAWVEEPSYLWEDHYFNNKLAEKQIYRHIRYAGRQTSRNQ